MKKIGTAIRHHIEDTQRDYALAPVIGWILFLAPFILLGLFIFFISYPPTQDFTGRISESHMGGEKWTFSHYPIEWVMFAAFLVGGMLSWRLAFRLKRAGQPRLVWIFYLIFAIGLLWTGGEVIAWGQKIFDYPTPHWFRTHNAQQQLTLHNLHGWQNRNHWLRFAFALAGFAGILLGRSARYRKIAAPAILFSWFLVIAIKCGLDFWTKSYAPDAPGPEFWMKIFPSNSAWQWNDFQWIINRASKLVKLLVALAALIYAWLNARELLRTSDSAGRGGSA